MAVTPVARLTRIILNAADPDKLARFFEDALGFERMREHRAEKNDFAPAAGLPGACARTFTLALGECRLDLVEVRGRPYPDVVPGWSPIFQHCAIVTADFNAAMARLRRRTDWRAISTGGPEVLPQRSGGVTAFKFRDPEGHPLELLSFPNGTGPKIWRSGIGHDPCLGIDHSAISVADTRRSVAFYAALGLTAEARSLNIGPEQDRLDDVSGATVEVTALTLPAGTKPHLELLCYRGDFPRNEQIPDVDDVAATRLVFAVTSMAALQVFSTTHADSIMAPGVERPGVSSWLLRDPDEHILQLEFTRSA
jgi:catechol 2,3-dioxygenase-like lactoylglutathione lyase family enzyme